MFALSFYLLSLSHSLTSCYLSPPIQVHTAVETMLGKLSSLKRASRSFAKTGFWVLFCRVFCGILAEMGAIWVPFGRLFGTF